MKYIPKALAWLLFIAVSTTFGAVYRQQEAENYAESTSKTTFADPYSAPEPMIMASAAN